MLLLLLLLTFSLAPTSSSRYASILRAQQVASDLRKLLEEARNTPATCIIVTYYTLEM